MVKSEIAPLEIEQKQYSFSSEPINNINLSKRILDYLSKKQGEILSNPSTNYLSIDEISNLVRQDPNIPIHSKKRIVLNYALKEVFSARNEKDSPSAFLYPIIYIENRKILCKIYAMYPKDKNSLEVSKFQEACFQKSIPALEVLLSYKYTSGKRINPSNYLYTLFKDNRNDERRYSPFEHSIEEELRSLCRKAFNPYNYIPVDAFLHDVIKYGYSLGMVMQITPEYHINNRNLSLDSDGNILYESEIYYHYFAHLSSLDKFLRADLSHLSNEYNLSTLSEEITLYKKKFSPYLSSIAPIESERTSLIIDIIESVPCGTIANERDKKLISAIKCSANILRKLFHLIPNYTNNRQINLTDNCINRLRRSVKNSSSEDKTLFQVNINQLVSECKPVSPEQKIRIEKEIRKVILNEFGSHEIPDASGESIFFLLDPAFLKKVIFNLAMNEEKYSPSNNLYQISKSIEKQLQYREKPLNSGIEDSELEEIEKVLPIQEKRISRKKTIYKLGQFLLNLISFVVLTGGISFFVFLKIYLGIPLKLLLSFPSGIFITFIIHSIIKKIIKD